MQKAAASAQRVFELLDTPPTIVSCPDAKVPPDPRFDLEFEEVCFGYIPEQPVLRDVSFQVGEG